MPVTQIEVTPAWQSYLDLNNDVKPFLQIPVGSVASDTVLQSIVDMACTWVQNYLGRPIAPTEFFRRFSGYWGTGNGGAYISLPYYPVTQMLSVVEFWGTSPGTVFTDACGLTNGQPTATDSSAIQPYVGASVTGPGIPAGTTILSVATGTSFQMSANYTGTTGTQTLTIQAKGHVLTEQTPLAQGTQDVYSMDYLRGYVIRAFMGLVARPFFPGLRNIEVTWTAGYNPIPADIRYATLKMIKHVWNSDQQASRSFPQPAGAREDEIPQAGPFGGIWADVRPFFAPYEQQGLG